MGKRTNTVHQPFSINLVP